MNHPLHRLETKVAAPCEFSSTAVTMGCCIMDVILCVFQPQLKKPLAKAGIAEALCCSAPCFGREIRDKKREIFSCSESHGLSHKTWKHEDESVCRS